MFHVTRHVSQRVVRWSMAHLHTFPVVAWVRYDVALVHHGVVAVERYDVVQAHHDVLA